MATARAALLVLAAVALGIVLVSGGSDADPRTPPALPGQPPPFLGTAVSGDGGLTAAVDAYGDVVDLRAPGPAGPALVDNPSARQAAGTVPADTGIVPRVAIGGGEAEPLWRADAVSQTYLAGTNVVRTVARLGRLRVVVSAAATGEALGVTARVRGASAARAVASFDVGVEGGARCRSGGVGAAVELVCGVGAAPRERAGALLARAGTEAREWLGAAGGANGGRPRGDGDPGGASSDEPRPLGAGAPGWARQMYWRSLLILHTLTDRRGGAVAAGARDGWAFVWPRDAATAALAYAAAGYRGEARRVARFLLRLGPSSESAARFDGSGAPVPGRGPQGDAAGWIVVAARAAGLRPPTPPAPGAWRHLPDYQEGAAGTYLGNALAASAAAGTASATPTGTGAGRIGAEFGTPLGLVRSAGDPGSGLDSAAAWAVRPFASPALFAAARRTLARLLAGGTRFGITPGDGWEGGEDPWMAPTAWSAWAFATLARAPGTSAADRAADRRSALRLLADLRRAATPAGALPERVDATTGIPRSTTPLAWPHAFAILALLELWPERAA